MVGKIGSIDLLMISEITLVIVKLSTYQIVELAQ